MTDHPSQIEELEALIAKLREENRELKAEIQRINRSRHEVPPHHGG